MSESHVQGTVPESQKWMDKVFALKEFKVSGRQTHNKMVMTQYESYAGEMYKCKYLITEKGITKRKGSKCELIEKWHLAYKPWSIKESTTMIEKQHMLTIQK